MPPISDSRTSRQQGRFQLQPVAILAIHPKDKKISLGKNIGDSCLYLKPKLQVESKCFGIMGGNLTNDFIGVQLHKRVVKAYPKHVPVDPMIVKAGDVHPDTGTRVTCVGNPTQQDAMADTGDAGVRRRVEDRPSGRCDAVGVAQVVENDHAGLAISPRYHGRPTRAVRVKHQARPLLNPEVALVVASGLGALDEDQGGAIGPCRGLHRDDLEALLKRTHGREQRLDSPDRIRNRRMELTLKQ